MQVSTFDVSSTLLFNVGVDAFSLITILITFLNSYHINTNSYGQRLFRKTQKALIGLLITDIIMWVINGQPGTFSRIINYADNIIFYYFVSYVTFTWLQYAWYRVYKAQLPKIAWIFSCAIPFVILNVITITSPWLKLVFYLDENNFYHRGILNIVFAVLFLCYLVFTSLIAFVQYCKTELLSDKKECLSICSFIVAPLIGGIVQSFTYGCSLAWPCTAFSMLLIYLNQQNREVSQDALTSLNNRATLDNYLQYRFNSEKKETLALIMFDINSFKCINDTYGHLYGDQALINFSSILKCFFGNTNAFLARYGGDEFVAIMRNCDEEKVKGIISKMNDSIFTFNENHKLPFPLSVSAGYSLFPSKEVNSAKGLIQVADHNMYENKKLYHLNSECK